ncbi:23S rRNA (uracil(1939)-C(5))-methyltransferase RlmD [Clostridium sp. P21]|uniref:23S rRNA (Uracil(1939)-C(5))-methyltransferase RlmD n=1 Tax=Clostridium muellerianum TaxID=2716538 RepID=A0A7Y0EF24_9CLOT|nr:23S rRNA (uracil(1939)-C(5))-methyltransferase RlmD [Clostridium muellerianum]
MNKNIFINKNEEYDMKITGMGYEGEGVGKINDFTVFVPGALLNEKVKVKVVKVNKNFAFAKLIDVIEASEHRTEPVCSIYKRCGGCQLQHYSYQAQLDFKKQRVKDCLERIGKLKVQESGEQLIDNLQDSGLILHDTIGMENPYRYRNKVQLPVGEQNGEVNIGFYAQRTHEIINMDTCNIQHEAADNILKLIKDWMRRYNIKSYNEQLHSGSIRHIMIRKAFKTNEVMVVIVSRSNELPHKKELIDMLLESKENIVSIIQNVNSKKTNVILGIECITLWGKDNISDYIGDFKFNISPLSFFQVNPVQTEVLYNKALEYASLTESETVFDAYCGTGTISLFLSQKAKKVYGIEIVPQAIENAKINANQNNINNAEFIVGESEKVIPELIKSGVKADVVVVDPPRKGCEKSLLEAIAQMAPERMVYVSCDPGTLARDLSILDELGYKATEVQPVDMFPQTAHVETVVQLTHKNADGFISVKMEYDESIDRLPNRVTYSKIQEYVESKYGFKVHTAYIAEVKRSLGLDMYEAPNKVEELKYPHQSAPAHKVEAIKDALKHFEVI